jgi:dTDP-4-dehydrorhamnose reductase
MPTILVFGWKGWIGGQMIPLLEASGFDVLKADVRADEPGCVGKLLDECLPDHVLSLLGRTHGEGVTTIDYLELPGKLVENIRDNLFAPLVVAEACSQRKIHFTYMGTGCIFCAEDPVKASAYTEASDPDFFGSSYSTVKGFTDRLMRMSYEKGALNVRIRMPITSDMSERNFIAKITKYKRICSIANSMTVLPTLLPLLCDMIKRRETGTINMVNPGYITHNDILELYKKHVDSGFTWENFTIAEQNETLLSKRSNNVLDTKKLETMYPDVPHIKDAVEMVMQTIAMCE